MEAKILGNEVILSVTPCSEENLNDQGAPKTQTGLIFISGLTTWCLGSCEYLGISFSQEPSHLEKEG